MLTENQNRISVSKYCLIIGILGVISLTQFLFYKCDSSRKKEVEKGIDKFLLEQANKLVVHRSGQTRNKPKPKFYIYNSPEFDWYQNCSKSHPKTFQTLKNKIFNSDDIYFLELAENHPQRTFNPEIADIYIIPVLFSLYSGVNQRVANSKPEYKNVLFDFQKLKNAKSTFRCEGKTLAKMLEITGNALLNNHYFRQNNGNDHLIVASHWRLSTLTESLFPTEETKIWIKILKNITIGTFEVIQRNSISFKDGIPSKLSNPSQKLTPSPWRCTIIVPYVDIGVHEKYLVDDRELLDFENWKSRKLDLFMIGKMVGDDLSHSEAYVTRRRLERIFSKNFDEKSKILFARSASDSDLNTSTNGTALSSCDEETCFTSVFSNNTSSSDSRPLNCTNCKAIPKMAQNYKNYLINSKFTLIIHGDTPTTSRLYDAISNMQIPIILSPSIYYTGLPFLEKVPWYDFCFFIDPFLVDDEVLGRKIFDVLDGEVTGEYILRHKFERMAEIRKDVLWKLEGNRVVENILDDKMGSCRL